MTNQIFFQAASVIIIERVSRLSSIHCVSLTTICGWLAAIADHGRLKVRRTNRQYRVIGMVLFNSVYVAIPTPPLPRKLVAVIVILFELVFIIRPDIKGFLNVNTMRVRE